jgi:hypothetical protein
MLFRKSARVYSIYWQDKEYVSWKRGTGDVPEAEVDNQADGSEHSVHMSNKFARFLIDLRIDADCEALKMKDGYLMMVTSYPSLYIFDLSRALAASNSVGEVTEEGGIQTEGSTSGEPTPELHELKPIVKRDFLFTVENLSVHQFVATSCIDFDEQCILHCTDIGFRIVCRSTFNVLYTVHEAPWQCTFQSPAYWAHCITSNAYVIPSAATYLVQDQRRPAIQQLRVANEVTELMKGTSGYRKDSSWRWEVVNMYVHDGLVLLSLRSGWIVGFPEYRNLINKKWDINDGRGCWLIDIGVRCDGMVFDGRRLVIHGVREVVSILEPSAYYQNSHIV